MWMGDNRTVQLLGNLVWALQAGKAVKAPPDAGVPGTHQASSSTVSVPTRPPPAAPGAPHAKVEGRTAPAATTGSREAHTHHRAEHDSSVAVGLHMLLTEGPRHVGIRLQEELCELLANQVVAAVPQEPAGSVAGHQDRSLYRKPSTMVKSIDSEDRLTGFVSQLLLLRGT